MGRKDHLPTADEVSRKTQRDTRRAIQTVYVGNPPVVTRNLQEAGITQKTENEVRDTNFPILANIEDLTDNIQTIVTATTKTINVELGKQEAQFHRLKLDDDSGTITDFFINFIGLAKNKALEFIADIETVFTSVPNITFNPPLAGLPTAFGDTGTNEFKMLVSAIDTPVVTSYEVISGGGDSGVDLLPLDNTWTGDNSWTGQTFDVNTTISTTINSPLFDVTSALFTIGDAPTDILNIISNIGSSLIPTVTDTFQIGSSSLEWNQVFTKEISALTETTITSPLLTITSALTTFGDSATDIFNFVGVIGSSLIPNVDLASDLGSVSKEWNNAFIATINAFTQTTISSPVLEIASLVNFSGTISVAPTYVAGVTQTFNPSTTAGVNVGSVSGNPGTLNNGDIWYNSSTDILFGYINGVITDLGAAGAATNSISQGDSSLTVVDGVGFTAVLDATAIWTLTAGSLVLGNIAISGVDDITFVAANTSIEVATNVVEHKYPATGTWKVVAGTTEQIVAVGAGVTVGASPTNGLGFYGTSPIVRQNTGGSDTLANLYTILRAYGLIDP